MKLIFLLILFASTAAYPSSGKKTAGVIYQITIPDHFDLAPSLDPGDKWLSSLIGNLAKRANRSGLVYSVYRKTSINCSVNGVDMAGSVFARDASDNRFLVWTQVCNVYHQKRPWLVSWDHGMVYETNPTATSFYLSPSGRYLIAIAPSSYGATYAKGQLSPRCPPVRQGESRSYEFDVGDVTWSSTLKISDEGKRFAEWHRLVPDVGE